MHGARLKTITRSMRSTWAERSLWCGKGCQGAIVPLLPKTLALSLGVYLPSARPSFKAQPGL